MGGLLGLIGLGRLPLVGSESLYDKESRSHVGAIYDLHYILAVSLTKKDLQDR